MALQPMTPTIDDDYADRLLREAARMMHVHCPRCAQARLRRIARHDVETCGIDYNEALILRQAQLCEMLGIIL